MKKIYLFAALIYLTLASAACTKTALPNGLTGPSPDAEVFTDTEVAAPADEDIPENLPPIDAPVDQIAQLGLIAKEYTKKIDEMDAILSQLFFKGANKNEIQQYQAACDQIELEIEKPLALAKFLRQTSQDKMERNQLEDIIDELEQAQYEAGFNKGLAGLL